MNKYGNKKTIVDGITFASKLEADRYAFLKIMEKSGKISDLFLQPKFTLQGTFHDRLNNVHRPIAYIADFEYMNGDKIVIEDCKGVLTKEYIIKKKLFLYSNRDVYFYEVKKFNDIGGLSDT